MNTLSKKDDSKKKMLIEYYSMYMNNILEIDLLYYKCKKINEHITILTATSFVPGPVLSRSNAIIESFNPFESYELVKEFSKFIEFIILILSDERFDIQMKNEILKKAKKNYLDKEEEFSYRFIENHFSEKIMNLLLKKLENESKYKGLYDTSLIKIFCKIIEYNVLEDDKSLCFQQFYLKPMYEEEGIFRLELLNKSIEISCPIVELWKVLLICIYINNDIDPDIKYATSISHWYIQYYKRMHIRYIIRNRDDSIDSIDSNNSYDTYIDDTSDYFAKKTDNLIKDMCCTIRTVAFQRRKHLMLILEKSYL